MSATDYLPTGLSPGDTFQLAFVTNAKISASSTDISVYNTFVQNQWNGSGLKLLIETYLNHSISFKCIGSTELVNAKDNAVVGSGSNFKGVYKLTQEKIADDFTDMWNGSIDSFFNINENGVESPTSGEEVTWVWTGTLEDGMSAAPSSSWLGALFPNSCVFGDTHKTDQQWIQNDVAEAAVRPLYALSEILTWPAPPPPPPPPPPCIVDNILTDKNYKQRFPYGRWNNTNTNLKLFPMTICHGTNGRIIKKQTKNVFKNTAMRMSQKQVYSYLIRNGIGPYTR